MHFGQPPLPQSEHTAPSLFFSSVGLRAFAGGLFGGVGVVAIVPAVAVEGGAAFEISSGFVPGPEPGKIGFGPMGLFATVFVPTDLRSSAENARVFPAGVERLRGDEGAEVESHAVVNVGIPPDGLLVQRLPADEQIEGRFACEDRFELAAQVLSGREASVGAFDPGLLRLALGINPVAEIGVDEFLQRAFAGTIRGGELVVVDEGAEATLQTVPNVPDERALVE